MKDLRPRRRRGARSPGRACQRGQAVVEFLVIAAALIPLFLLTPLVAKYQDLAHATQMASRYAAFDAFVNQPGTRGWKPAPQLANEVRRRFFSDSAAPVLTGDVAGDAPAHRNVFWSGPRGVPLIENIARDVRVSFGDTQAAEHDAGFRATVDGAPFALREALRLPARGIYTVNVSVALADLPAELTFYRPFDEIGLAIRRGTSVVIDPWMARSPADVEQRIADHPALFPAQALAAVAAQVGSAVIEIEAPAALPAPRLGRLEFWRDVVPKDRLKARP